MCPESTCSFGYCYSWKPHEFIGKILKCKHVINFKELELIVTPSKSLSPYFQKLMAFMKGIYSHPVRALWVGTLFTCYHVLGPSMPSAWSIMDPVCLLTQKLKPICIKNEVDKNLKIIHCVPISYFMQSLCIVN